MIIASTSYDTYFEVSISKYLKDFYVKLSHFKSDVEILNFFK